VDITGPSETAVNLNQTPRCHFSGYGIVCHHKDLVSPSPKHNKTPNCDLHSCILQCNGIRLLDQLHYTAEEPAYEQTNEGSEVPNLTDENGAGRKPTRN